MIALLALALTAGAQAGSDDIVITAVRKLDDWRANLAFAGDEPECRTVKSTNDAELDAIGCKAMVQCYADARPRLLAVSGRSLTPRARRQMRIDANRDLDACFRSTRRSLVLELYARKAPQEASAR